MTAKDREATASYPKPRCFDRRAASGGSLTEANEVNEDLVNTEVGLLPLSLPLLKMHKSPRFTGNRGNRQRRWGRGTPSVA
jgi:hypothetical protein